MRAVLSIGANLADRKAALDTVLAEFREELVAASSVYVTPAWGVRDQPDFLNMTLIVEVTQAPLQLLRRGQRLEEAAHRRRQRRWGPRTLDVDIVAAWEEDSREVTMATADLTIPHPYAAQRAFVLVPWLEIEPSAQLAGESVRELVDRLSPADVAGIQVWEDQ